MSSIHLKEIIHWQDIVDEWTKQIFDQKHKVNGTEYILQKFSAISTIPSLYDRSLSPSATESLTKNQPKGLLATKVVLDKQTRKINKSGTR